MENVLSGKELVTWNFIHFLYDKDLRHERVYQLHVEMAIEETHLKIILIMNFNL